MPRIIKNTLLNYIPTDFEIEKIINPARIFEFNNKPIKNGKIIYLCEREIRVKDNFALQFALQKSEELNLPLKIIHPKINYEYKPKQVFINNQIEQTERQFTQIGLNFEVIEKTPEEIIKNSNPALIILDFNPILKRDYLKKSDFKIYEIDGHNIIPARFVSNKQEYSAATMRRKIYYNIYPFLTEFDNLKTEKVEADYVLEDFIKNKLPYYAEYKNDISKNVLSGLSKYLNLGFISSQRVALEIIKSKVENINKEVFLEELIVRKELADNFCLYSQNYNDFSGVPNWAKMSLNNHKFDIRPYIYCPNDKTKSINEMLDSIEKQKINPRELDDLMLAQEMKTITSQGIRFLKTDYYNDALYGLRQKVIIKYSLFDLSYINVYSVTGKFLCRADRITLTHPLAKYTGEIKDVEDYKQKIQKQKQLKNKTIKACKEFLDIEDLEILECEFADCEQRAERSADPFIASNQAEEKEEEFLPISNAEIKNEKTNQKTKKEKYNPAIRPLFKTSRERYEYLMKHGCTCNDDRVWLSDYKQSKEYRQYETEIC